jgi:hypothetical protein
MVTLAGVKKGKENGQVPVAEVQVVLLVDPSGAVTTTVTGVSPGAPVTSTTKPVQPITVQALGPTRSHPEPKAATSTRVIANTSRGIVTNRILACEGARAPECRGYAASLVVLALFDRLAVFAKNA